MKLRSGEYRRRLRRIEGANLHARFLTFSCFHNQPFLSSPRACGWAIDAIRMARARHPVHLWCWCIMPTHVHLILWPTTPECRMGRVLATIKQSAAQRAIHWTRHNAPQFLPRMTDPQPHSPTCLRFWQRGSGYDRNISTTQALWNEIRYIHRNPAEAGLCAHPTDYEWSSARTFKNPGAGPLPLDLNSIPRT